MINIKNNGDYFVKDSEWLPSQKDEFRHEDIAKNIISLIDNESPPFNIAIVGRWGIGKSSLINMTRQYLEKMSNEYVIEEINAWKYEKEALRRVFLKRMLSKLGYNDKSATRELSDSISSFIGNKTDDKMNFSCYIKEWLPLLGVSFMIYVTCVILSFLGQIIFSSINNVEFNKNTWLNFLLTEVPLSFYIPILVVLIQQYIKGANGRINFKLTAPIKSTDEYEELLKTILNKNDKKIITIIDDLDRLTPDKIVEALDAIKAFVNYDNCIFIVPFDDTILKKALKNKTISFTKNEHLLIESELFLDKLFQYKFYLPNVISSDLPQYAIDLVQTEAKDLYALLDDIQFKRIVKEILIHKGVSTPRQVKKIINAFANHLLLAIRREDGRVPKDTFLNSNNIQVLAKVSTLQADFSDFYSKMFDYPDLIDKFMEIVNTINSEETEQLYIPEYLKPYFVIEDNISKLSKSAENLYMFLSRTSNISCDNYSPFLYMDYDSFSVIFGSELSRDLRNSLTSGAIEIVKDRLDSNIDIDLSDLLYNILSNAEPYEYSSCCEVLVEIYSDYNLSNNKNLLELIAHRISSIYSSGFRFNSDKIRFDQLCEFKKIVSDKTGLNKAISLALLTEDKNMKNRMEYFFANYLDFNDNTKNKVKNYINIKLGNSKNFGISEFSSMQSIDASKHFDPYLNSISLLEKLSNFIIEDGSYDSNDTSVTLFTQLLNNHIETENFNAALLSIMEKLEDEDLFMLISDLLNSAISQIDEKAATKLFNVFMNYKDENVINKSIELLSKLSWLIEESVSQSVDEYLKSILSDDNINDILINILQHKQVNLIPNTIAQINSSFIESRINYDTLYKLQSRYTKEQTNQLMIYLTNYISFSQNPQGKNFDIVGAAIDGLSKYTLNGEPLNIMFISKLYMDITQRANHAYSIAAASLLPNILSVINPTQKQQFLTWSTTPSNVNNYPELTIKLMDIFHNDLTEQHIPAISTVLNIVDPSLSSSILRLLRFTRRLLIKNNEELSLYENYLISKLPEENLRINIMDDIKWFNDIKNLYNFIKSGIVYEDVRDSFIEISSTFLNNLADSEDIFDKLLHEISYTDISALYTLIQKVKNENIDSFIYSLIDCSSENDSIIYIVNLLSLYILHKSTFDNNLNKLSKIIFTQGDDKVINTVLSKLLKLQVPVLSSIEKRLWANDLYHIFRKSSKEVKIHAYRLAIKIEAKNTFMKDTKRRKRDFSEEENIIIKNIG